MDYSSSIQNKNKIKFSYLSSTLEDDNVSHKKKLFRK